MKNLILIVALILNMGLAFSQQGPVIECFNCEDLTAKPYPTNGSWYNPQQSGSGYILEVQNGLLSGFYFGYDTEGVPTWTNFVGFLEEGEGDVLWTLDANMLKFENGNAFNQPFQSPDANESGDSIHIDFMFKNYAKVSVNDGEVQNMIPLTFGVLLSHDLPQTDFLFPELEGMWTFVYENKTLTSPREYNFSSQVYHIYEKSLGNNSDGSISVEYFIFYYSQPNDVTIVGSINCRDPIDDIDDELEVKCILKGFPGVGQEMIIPIGDLGAFSFSAEDSTGGVLKGYRVNFLDVF